MRAFVTGGSGFVGKWLQAHLREQGDDLIAPDVDLDVTDWEAMREAVAKAMPKAVYHLAAVTHVGDSWQDPAAVFRVNALGTLNVLEAARACEPPPRVLLVSSAEVYGSVTEAALPLTEETPLGPTTPYAASKVAAEFLGVQARLGHGLDVICVRPFNHVGPGQAPRFAVSAIAKRIVDAQATGGRSLRVGNLAPRRDFTDVRDVVRAYRLLVDAGERGGVYNVCSGRDVSIADLAARLLTLADADLELDVDPELSRPVDVPVLRGSYERLARLTAWRPEIDLDATLRSVLEYWRAETSEA